MWDIHDYVIYVMVPIIISL